MPRFMLDTDTVSYALRGYGNVKDRIVERRPSELCVSALTIAELRYGANRRKSAKLRRLIDVFATEVTVMPFDEECATAFGWIAAELAAEGAVIGEFDTLIAAHALVCKVTLVTNNIKHFSRVARLNVESWL